MSQPIKCPACFNALTPIQVEIDECPGCGGYWLDAGELEKIREETETTRLELAARQPVVTGKVIRYLYQLRTEKRLGE